MCDSLWKLETSSALYSLQPAEQITECPFQVAQVIWASSRQLNLSKSVS